MKESNFYSDDFEQLIREKTEQYKMYPSERVWKGVHNSLHTKRRWFIGSMSLLVTGILFFAGRELISPSSHPVVLRKPASPAASLAEVTKPWVASHHPRNSIASLHNNGSTGTGRHSNAATDDRAEQQDTEYRELSITLAHPVIDPAGLAGWLNHIQLPDHAPEITVFAAKNGSADNRLADDGLRPGTRPGPETSRETGESLRNAEGLDADGLSARDVLESLGAKADLNRNNRINGRLAKNGANGKAIGGGALLPDSAASRSANASATAIAEAGDRQRINWLHDYALNSLPASASRGRTFFQLLLAPTVNYRSINGLDPAYEKWGNPAGFNMSPNKLMNNTPAFGFEFGGAVLYRLTRNLSVKGGLQFNFARYKITAFQMANSGAPAGVDLNSYLGYLVNSQPRWASTSQRASAANYIDTSVNILTLNNDYYQLSAPIGFELRVLGNERLQFNIGATIQPSYLLGATSYTLNSDMTKYNKEPGKYRKWNVSGGLEAFLSYRTGNIRWQVGPEFRYQILSTYSSQYPITENLKTYGLKLGLTKMLP